MSRVPSGTVVLGVLASMWQKVQPTFAFYHLKLNKKFPPNEPCHQDSFCILQPYGFDHTKRIHSIMFNPYDDVDHRNKNIPSPFQAQEWHDIEDYSVLKCETAPSCHVKANGDGTCTYYAQDHQTGPCSQCDLYQATGGSNLCMSPIIQFLMLASYSATVFISYTQLCKSIFILSRKVTGQNLLSNCLTKSCHHNGPYIAGWASYTPFHQI